MVARTSRRRRLDTLEAQASKVQRVNEHVDRPDRVLFRHPVIEELRQQHALTAILTLDKALHRPALSRVDG
jgi:hypothetical protein